MNNVKVVNKEIGTIISSNEDNYELLVLINKCEPFTADGYNFVNLTNKQINISYLNKIYQNVPVCKFKKDSNSATTNTDYRNLSELSNKYSNYLILISNYSYESIKVCKDRIEYLSHKEKISELEKEELRLLKREVKLKTTETNSRITFFILTKFDLTGLNEDIGYLDRDNYIYIALATGKPNSVINVLDYINDNLAIDDKGPVFGVSGRFLVMNKTPNGEYWFYDTINKRAEKLLVIQDESKEDGLYYYTKSPNSSEYHLDNKILVSDNEFAKIVFPTKELAEVYNNSLNTEIDKKKISDIKLQTEIVKVEKEKDLLESEKELLRLKNENIKLQEDLVSKKVKGDSRIYEKKYTAASTKLDTDIFKASLAGIGVVAGGVGLLKSGIFNKESVESLTHASRNIFKTFKNIFSSNNSIWSSISNFLKEVVNSITSMLGGVKDKVVPYIKNVYNFLSKSFINKVLPTVKTIYNTLKENATSGINIVKNTWSKVKDKISSFSFKSVTSFSFL